MTVFREGSPVHVITLRKDGVVVAVLGSDRYRVAVGSMTITCALTALTEAKSAAIQPRGKIVELPKIPPPPDSVDLHGLSVTEAIRKLDAWLDRAALAGLSQVKVIHGLGSGRIQRAVHAHLSTLRIVRHFKVNVLNPGETDIYL